MSTVTIRNIGEKILVSAARYRSKNLTNFIQRNVSWVSFQLQKFSCQKTPYFTPSVPLFSSNLLRNCPTLTPWTLHNSKRLKQTSRTTLGLSKDRKLFKISIMLEMMFCPPLLNQECNHDLKLAINKL